MSKTIVIIMKNKDLNTKIAKINILKALNINIFLKKLENRSFAKRNGALLTSSRKNIFSQYFSG